MENITVLVNSIEDEKRRADSLAILELMRKITGEPAIMWGKNIVGFGKYRYKNASGKEVEWFLTGFSPRKKSLTLYLTSGFDQLEGLLDNLGKFKTGKACLYINKLEDVNREILERLILRSIEQLKSMHS